MMMPQAILILIMGAVVGVASGMFGVGGGILIVPLLVYGLGFSQITASATSLVAMLAPVGILGVYTYYRAGMINADHLKVGAILALGLFVGAYVGARLAIVAPTEVLRKGFAALLVIAALRMWFH